MRKELEEKDRISALKLEGIYNVQKFGSVSGYGDIYPAVCEVEGLGTTTGWYSSFTKTAYYRMNCV